MRKRGYLTRITAVLAAVFVLVLSLPQLPAHAATLLTDMGEGADITYTKWYYYADPASPNLHCSFDTSRIDGIFEQWDERLFHESEAITGREDCKHIALYYGYQGYTTGSYPSYGDREFVFLISLSDLGVDNRYGLMLHNNGIFIVHPTKTTVKYFSAFSDKGISDASDTLVHDYQTFERAGVRNDQAFPSTSLSFNGVPLYGWKITSLLMDSYVCEGTIFNTDIPVFTDATAYMNYYETGDMSGAIRLPDMDEPEYVYDNSIGFDTNACVMQRVTLDKYGPQNVRVDYSLTQSTSDLIFYSTHQWYIDCNLSYSYQYTSESALEADRAWTCGGGFIVLRVPIESFRHSSFTFHAPSIMMAPLGYKFDNGSCILNRSDIDMNLLKAAIALLNRCGIRTSYDWMSCVQRCTPLGVLSSDSSGLLQPAIDLFESGATHYMNDFSFTADFYITDGVTRGSVGHGTLDLLNGFYTGYTAAVDDSGSAVMDGVLDFSGRNEYVWDNSSGDSYYYDYSNHTVNNYTTPSANFSDNIAMTHTFSSPLHMFVDNAADLAPTILVNNYPSSGGGSGSSSGDGYDITIEDDDYTHDTLVDYMKHGFELFDNTDTGEKGDGLMAGAAALFGMLGDDMAAMLGFGVGSVVVINILRSLIKR